MNGPSSNRSPKPKLFSMISGTSPPCNLTRKDENPLIFPRFLKSRSCVSGPRIGETKSKENAPPQRIGGTEDDLTQEEHIAMQYGDEGQPRTTQKEINTELRKTAGKSLGRQPIYPSWCGKAIFFCKSRDPDPSRNVGAHIGNVNTQLTFWMCQERKIKSHGGPSKCAILFFRTLFSPPEGLQGRNTKNIRVRQASVERRPTGRVVMRLVWQLTVGDTTQAKAASTTRRTLICLQAALLRKTQLLRRSVLLWTDKRVLFGFLLCKETEERQGHVYITNAERSESETRNANV